MKRFMANGSIPIRFRFNDLRRLAFWPDGVFCCFDTNFDTNQLGIRCFKQASDPFRCIRLCTLQQVTVGVRR